MEWYVGFVNQWLTNNPVLQIAAVLAGFGVIRGIPWGYHTLTGKLRREAEEKHHSRQKLDQIELHLSDINGSIKRHHADTTIHFTHEACHDMHKGLVDDFNKTAGQIFTRIDQLADEVSYQRGRMDAGQ